MIDFVKTYQVGEPIPEQFKVVDKNNRYYETLLTLWIEYRQGEPIPKEFEYDGWQTDKNNYGKDTPLMQWIKYR